MTDPNKLTPAERRIADAIEAGHTFCRVGRTFAHSAPDSGPYKFAGDGIRETTMLSLKAKRPDLYSAMKFTRA